jgi:pyruvate dehydrogenase E2 component (dihydrolipoyllysine-residue acetyltransferase)
MDIVMPKMGESISEGTIIKWHKKKGDEVKRDEIIFEISTDKVDTEIPSPADGVISEILFNEGDTVEVGTIVAKINENGEAPDKSKDESNQHKEKEVTKTGINHSEEKKMQQKSEKDTAKNADKNSSQGEMIELSMPKMGESVMEGTIIKWHKKVGDTVKKDETLFEISTDKVDTEIPSPEDGVLKEILVAEQETVEVGTVVAKLYIGSSGESSNVKTGKDTEEFREKAKPATEKPREADKETKTEEMPAVKEPSSMHDNFTTISKVVSKEEKPDNGEMRMSGFYSPLVISIANKEKVSRDELENINGTGLNGRVTKKDILTYLENRGQGKAHPSAKEISKPVPETSRNRPVPSPSFEPSALKPSYTSDQVEKIPMDNIRQKIFQHMIKSRDTSVHVSAMLEVDMSKIHNFIQRKRDEYQKNEGIKLTYMPFIAYACVKGLKEFPLINSSLEENLIIRKKFINLGIAVAIEPAGLIVPNIKAADEKNIIGLAKAINELAYKARNKKLSPDDISDGTFSITNYGVFGTIFGTPIINQPEVAILGVGAVIKRPVAVEVNGNDAIAVKPIMALTLSHDHRLVDGMLGGRFLKFIKDTLESFDESTI